jgi:hypothetical protein
MGTSTKQNSLFKFKYGRWVHLYQKINTQKQLPTQKKNSCYSDFHMKCVIIFCLSRIYLLNVHLSWVYFHAIYFS